MVEHFLGKEEVTSSSLVNSSRDETSVAISATLVFFVISEALTRDLYKPSFTKGGFGWNVNITPVGATAPTSSSLVNSSKEDKSLPFLFIYPSLSINKPPYYQKKYKKYIRRIQSTTFFTTFVIAYGALRDFASQKVKRESGENPEQCLLL